MTELRIIRSNPEHAVIMSEYFMCNETHLAPWSPKVPSHHHSIDCWRRRLTEREREFERGESVHFIGSDTDQSHVIGSCSLSNIVRGVFQACHLSYSIAARYQGKGHMKLIVKHAIAYAFDDLRLHRIMANHMPSNIRSEGLLKSLDFEREGYARSFIRINGKWEDHVLNSLVNPIYKNLPGQL